MKKLFEPFDWKKSMTRNTANSMKKQERQTEKNVKKK